jgi:hypothetical protein
MEPEEQAETRKTGKTMTASETIEHFSDMGVLDRTIISQGECAPIVILASATRGYAERCMRDFEGTDGYFVGSRGIDARTSDGVPVVMTFI